MLPLELWFVNVGHGDSTIVRFPSGRVMMVDINNCKSLDETTEKEVLESLGTDPFTYKYAWYQLSEAKRAEARSYEDRLEDPIDVMKRECPGKDVFRFVASHPHLDHLTGIYRLSRQEDGIGIENFWDTANNRQMSDADFKAKDDAKNWEEYQRVRFMAESPKALNLLRGASAEFYQEDGIEILAPTQKMIDDANELNTYEGWNHLSYVLRITYGSSSVILAADTSIAAQTEMVELYGDKLRSNVLKAPHHGRDSGFCGSFAGKVSPDFTIVSVGKKPATDATNKYWYHTRKRTLTTRLQGTIHARTYGDGYFELYNHRGQRLDLDEDQQKAPSASYPASKY